MCWQESHDDDENSYETFQDPKRETEISPIARSNCAYRWLAKEHLPRPTDSWIRAFKEPRNKYFSNDEGNAAAIFSKKAVGSGSIFRTSTATPQNETNLQRTNHQCSKLLAFVVSVFFAGASVWNKRISKFPSPAAAANDPCLKNPFCRGPIIWLTQNTYFPKKREAYVASHPPLLFWAHTHDDLKGMPL